MFDGKHMRILIMANSDGGLYIFRRMLIKTLLNKGHNIYITNPTGEFAIAFSQMGCKYIPTDIDRRGINPVTDLKLIRKYFAIVKEIQPDLVITYTIKPNIYGGIVCRWKKIPYVVNITGLGTVFQKKGLLRSIVITLYRTALKKARVVFFENAENKKIMESLKISGTDQSKLLNGAGVDLEHFSYEEYPKDGGTTYFLFIGRVMKEKGIDELFAVMQRLRSEGEDCVLNLVGEYEEDYSATMERYQKEGWLNYYGYQKDVRPFIKTAHCFVLPSWHEGMANTNLEAAATGRPVITSDIAGCREAVIDGRSGLLCESKNVDSLYQIMERFLDLSPEQRKQMGAEGRKHMERVFDKRKVVEETMIAMNL